MSLYSLNCTAESGMRVGDSVLVEFREGTNLPPVANAGPDQLVGSTHRVELSTLYSDDDYQFASSAWRQTGGPPVTLGPGYTTFNASFIAPNVTSDTVLTFELTMTDDEGLTSAPDSVNVTVQPIPPTVTINGDVQYERVPQGPPGEGLRYADQGFAVIADVFVEVLDAATHSVIASGRFAGDFQFTVPSQTELVLRATAQSARQAPQSLPHWQISVRDLDAGGVPLGEVYSYIGPALNSGAGGRHSLRIPSGWNTAGQLIGPRHAAPFAILDSMRSGLRRIELEAAPPDLPALVVDWAPTNRGGEAFYVADPGGAHRIVLSGEVDVDTDEYDPSVILHELGHYLMNTVSRDESIGGEHAFGDRLDMRVAFSEGFATAFSAYAYGNTGYVDSFGPGQGDSGFFDVNSDYILNEGWYNEFSVQELLWDFGDFATIWQALHAPLQQTDALTSVFPFFAALKQLRPDAAANIDALLANEQMVGATIDAYGSTETNDAGSVNVLPIYTPIAVGGTVVVRSTNEFGTGNKLANHRYLRLSLPAATNVHFEVTAAAGRDPDIAILRRGVSLGPDPGPANESFTLALDAGDYILDVYDCGNAGCNPGVPAAATDITVSITSN